MKVKVSRIVSAVGVLRAIDTTKMKLSTSYKVKLVLGACQTAIEDFEAKRKTLAETHGTLSEDKTHYDFKDEDAQEAFQAGMQEMMDDEVDIDVTPIPLELVDEHLQIEPANVELVSWFIAGLE